MKVLVDIWYAVWYVGVRCWPTFGILSGMLRVGVG